MGVKLDSQPQKDVDTSYIGWAILVGMIAPCTMTTKHVVIRKFKGNYGAIA